MNLYHNVTSDNTNFSSVKNCGARRASSSLPLDTATVTVPGQSKPSASSSPPVSVAHFKQSNEIERQSSDLQPKPFALASSNDIGRNASISLSASSCKETPSRPRESWEMMSDSYSVYSESENNYEETGPSSLKARESHTKADNERYDRIQPHREAANADTGDIFQNEKQDIEGQYKEDKYRLRRQLSGLPLVTVSDENIWPCRQTQMTRAQALEEANLPRWPYKLNPLRKLGKRPKFAAKIAIAIFIIGSAVGIGVGVSGVAGGGAVQVAIKPNAIA